MALRGILYLGETSDSENHEVEDGHHVDPLKVVLGHGPVLQVGHSAHINPVRATGNETR